MRIQTAKPGFTMIELLVVVLLIAILITITIGVGSSVIARGKTETTRKNMQLVMEAIDAFAETDTANTPPKSPPVERGTAGAPAPFNVFPDINSAGGTRDTSNRDFVTSNPEGDKNWMVFLRAKLLSQQLVGGAEVYPPAFPVTAPRIYTGNAAAKTRVGNAPTVAFPFSYTECDASGTHTGGQPLFIDAYGKYMDYSSGRGVGGAALLISAGPDGKFGNEDDIRSDRK